MANTKKYRASSVSLPSKKIAAVFRWSFKSKTQHQQLKVL